MDTGNARWDIPYDYDISHLDGGLEEDMKDCNPYNMCLEMRRENHRRRKCFRKANTERTEKQMQNKPYLKMIIRK